MAIRQEGMRWYSDLLPNAEFQSVEEARYYDRRAAMQLNAGREQLETALKDTPSASLPALIKATMAVAADNDKQSQLERQEVIEQFLSQTPELVKTGEKGLHNRSVIIGFLHALGVLQPSVYDYKRAYEDLKSMGDLYIKR
jgi:hypothetical protein